MIERFIFMNNRILLFCSIFLFLGFSKVKAQNLADALPMDSLVQGPQMTFVSPMYNFGKVRQGDKINTSFFFKNTGNQPLIILQVQTSCGCTVSNWSRDPVLPGQTGEINVTFDSGEQKDHTGDQKKVLLVISNSIEKEQQLVLLGQVSKVER